MYVIECDESKDQEEQSASFTDSPEKRHSGSSYNAKEERLDARIARTAVSDKNYDGGFNESIKELAIMKSMDAGTLTIRFRLDMQKGFGFPFLLRMFDRNGNYLRRIVTEPIMLLQHEGIIVQGRGTLTYSVNLRDLRDVEIAEFGIVVHPDFRSSMMRPPKIDSD
jgi:hypothetical protein